MTLSVLTYALFKACAVLQAALGKLACCGLSLRWAWVVNGRWRLGHGGVAEQIACLYGRLDGAAANVGYLLVGFVGLVLLDWLGRRGWLLGGYVGERCRVAGWLQRLAAHDDFGHGTGTIDLLIRIFVPESEKWEKEPQAVPALGP
jgi:hypothetical protein